MYAHAHKQTITLHLKKTTTKKRFDHPYDLCLHLKVVCAFYRKVTLSWM